MAFTSAEKLKIAQIVGLAPSLLDAHLLSLGVLSADTEAAVIAELARWDDFGSKFVKIHPRESNFGVETDSGNAKADIKRNIALLLELTVYVRSARYGTMYT